jgi:hypothetical protein
LLQIIIEMSGQLHTDLLQIYNESANQDRNRIKNYIMRMLGQMSSATGLCHAENNLTLMKNMFMHVSC